MQYTAGQWTPHDPWSACDTVLHTLNSEIQGGGGGGGGGGGQGEREGRGEEEGEGRGDEEGEGRGAFIGFSLQPSCG